MENKNKNKLSTATKTLIAGASVVAMSSAVIGQADAATAANPMSALLLAPIVITPDTMHFGSFTAAGADGTITMDPAGVRTPTAAISVATGGAATAGAADIAIAGANNAVVVASVPAGTVTATIAAVTVTAGYSITDGTDVMEVGAFVIDPATTGAISGTNDTTNVTLSAGGTGGIRVGGTLLVEGATGGADVAGTYTGNFTIDVSYQ